MRLTGDMVPQDPKAAAEWFGQAESGGFEVEAWLRRLGLERPGPTP
jgi:TPR repeat protein